MKRIMISLLVMPLFMACDEDEKDPGVPVLTVEVDRNAFPRSEQKWIYISDVEGNILDSEMINTAGTFTLNSETLPETVDVTLYTIRQLNFQRSHELVTFLRVPTNKPFKIKRQPFTFNPPVVGTIKFEIENYNFNNNGSQNFFVSNGNSPALFPFSIVFESNSIKGVYPLTFGDADVLFRSMRDGYRVYSWARDVHIDDVVKLDHSNFMPFEQSLTLPYSTYGTAVGILNGRSYDLSTTLNTPYQSEVLLEYINGFDYYSTSLYAYVGPRSHNYLKVGEIPASVDWPSYAGYVTNPSIDNFTYNESEDYTYRSVAWTLINKAVQWQVYGDANTLQVKFLPRELHDSFPNVQLADFMYSGQTLYKRMDGVTYLDYLDERLGIKEPPKFYEYFYSVGY